MGGGTKGDGRGFVGQEATLIRAGVVVFDKEGVDVVIHGEATGACGVIPGQVNASIEVA